MAHFITRVQLNGAPTEEHYDRLHAAMEAKGFVRWVHADNGKTYWLPHAEYSRTTNANVSVEQIRADAIAAAGSVWTGFQVLVTQGNWAGHGLIEAT